VVINFLDALAELRKAAISCVMSVHLLVWKISAFTGRIFTKFYILRFFEKYVEKVQVSLKSDEHNRYFTWRPVYIFW